MANEQTQINLTKELKLNLWNGGAFNREPQEFKNDIREYYVAKDVTTLMDPNDEESGVTKTVLKLDHKESITEKIQSQMDETDLATIIAKYNITGDPTLMNRSVPLDPAIADKVARIPVDPNEATEYITKKRDEFQEMTGLEKLTVKELLTLLKQNEAAKQTNKESKETKATGKETKVETVSPEAKTETKTEAINNGNNSK